MLKIHQMSPTLSLPTLNGDSYDLSLSVPEKFSMAVFYRGYHCPVCKKYLEGLNRLVYDFQALGVDDIICVSGDSSEKAALAKEEWEISNLNVAYSQTVRSMKEWGLYVSSSISAQEPEYFGEPGLFLITPEKKIFYACYNSMPFGRPPFKELLDALSFIEKENYPARGHAKI